MELRFTPTQWNIEICLLQVTRSLYLWAPDEGQTRWETHGVEVMDQHEVVQQVSKKAKLEKPMEFCSKGNEVQYKFNGAVVDACKEVSAQLETATAGELGTSSASATKVTSTFQVAREAVEEGEKHLETWQKHVRLADQSELGWMVVKEYETDKLAAAAADEKRMADAEKAAEKKAAAKGKKQKTIGKYTQPQSSGYRPAPYQNLLGHRSQYSSPRMPYHPTAAAAKPVLLFPLSRSIGSCWGCNEYGHFRSMCPKLVSIVLRSTLHRSAVGLCFFGKWYKNFLLTNISSSSSLV